MTKSFTELQEESNTVGVEFLLTEVSAGHTFMDLADTTGEGETRTRNRGNAHLAYETLLYYAPRVIMEEPQLTQFADRVRELKRRLAEAGLSV